MMGLPLTSTVGLDYNVVAAGPGWGGTLETADIFQMVAVRSGEAWFSCDGLADPVRLLRGSIVCTTGRVRQFWLEGGAPRPTARTSALALSRLVDGGHVHASLLVGRAPLNANPSLHGFPLLFIISPDDPGMVSCLDALFELVEKEACDASSDREARDLVRRASELLVVMLARYVARHAPRESVVWGRGPIDPKVMRAIRLIETDIQRGWTVETLATEVGMGRSAFAVRFRELVGDTPVNCLFKTRMRFASQLICAQGSSIASVADAIGYQSESAFSKAFFRHFGVTPGQYRAAQKTERDKGRAASRRSPWRRLSGATEHAKQVALV